MATCKCNSCNRTARAEWDGYCKWHYPPLQRETRLKNRDRFKGYDLKRDYGISLEAYTEMLVKQQGLCAICGTANGSERSNNNGRKVLGVDHNHATGAIRGLLCARCNAGLGNFQENPEWLVKAAEYLESYSKEHAEAAQKVKDLLEVLRKR